MNVFIVHNVHALTSFPKSSNEGLCILIRPHSLLPHNLYTQSAVQASQRCSRRAFLILRYTFLVFPFPSQAEGYKYSAPSVQCRFSSSSSLSSYPDLQILTHTTYSNTINISHSLFILTVASLPAVIMVSSRCWARLVLFFSASSFVGETWASPLNSTIGKRNSPVPFGAILDRCVIPGTVALTFDDGPFIFTPDLLELLSAYGARSTFFLNGQNKGSFHGGAAVVRRIFQEGHQIGSHTYVSTDSIIHCRS